MGETWWRDNPDLVQRMEARYNRYRQIVVVPALDTLASCDGLVILVDVADILHGGPKHLNEAHASIDRILDALKPGGRITDWRRSHLGLRRRIRRIAVAASQCDRFHPSDKSELVELVKGLAERKVKDIDGIEDAYFACSAVKSTDERGEARVKGIRQPAQDGSGQATPAAAVTPAEAEYDVCRLPKGLGDRGWPSRWNCGEYYFPRVLPQMPAVLNAVPAQSELDRVFGFVTGWFPKTGD